MMNALRLRTGVGSELFAQRTGLSLQQIQPTLQKLADKGLIEANYQHHLATTERGFALLNEVLIAFL